MFDKIIEEIKGSLTALTPIAAILVIWAAVVSSLFQLPYNPKLVLIATIVLSIVLCLQALFVTLKVLNDIKHGHSWNISETMFYFIAVSIALGVSLL